MLGAIPPAINDAARNAFSARALIFAILLAEDETVRENQIQTIHSTCDSATAQETTKLAVPVAEMGPAARRVLVDLAIPALRQLSKPQCEQFGRAVNALVDADSRVTLFEYMLTRMLNKGVLAKGPVARPQVTYAAMKPLIPDVQVLLSALAGADAKNPAATKAAFDAGWNRLQVDQPPTPSPDQGVAAIDAAIDRISKAVPGIKRRVVDACAFCVAADGIIQPEEAELLRAVTTALDCPLPPLMEEPAGVAA
jgi:hypothetical protein